MVPPEYYSILIIRSALYFRKELTNEQHFDACSSLPMCNKPSLNI